MVTIQYNLIRLSAEMILSHLGLHADMQDEMARIQEEEIHRHGNQASVSPTHSFPVSSHELHSQGSHGNEQHINDNDCSPKSNSNHSDGSSRSKACQGDQSPNNSKTRTHGNLSQKNKHVEITQEMNSNSIKCFSKTSEISARKIDGDVLRSPSQIPTQTFPVEHNEPTDIRVSDKHCDISKLQNTSLSAMLETSSEDSVLHNASVISGTTPRRGEAESSHGGVDSLRSPGFFSSVGTPCYLKPHRASKRAATGSAEVNTAAEIVRTSAKSLDNKLRSKVSADDDGGSNKSSVQSKISFVKKSRTRIGLDYSSVFSSEQSKNPPKLHTSTLHNISDDSMTDLLSHPAFSVRTETDAVIVDKPDSGNQNKSKSDNLIKYSEKCTLEAVNSSPCIESEMNVTKFSSDLGSPDSCSTPVSKTSSNRFQKFEFRRKLTKTMQISPDISADSSCVKSSDGLRQRDLLDSIDQDPAPVYKKGPNSKGSGRRTKKASLTCINGGKELTVSAGETDWQIIVENSIGKESETPQKLKSSEDSNGRVWSCGDVGANSTVSTPGSTRSTPGSTRSTTGSTRSTPNRLSGNTLRKLSKFSFVPRDNLDEKSPRSMEGSSCEKQVSDESFPTKVAHSNTKSNVTREANNKRVSISMKVRNPNKDMNLAQNIQSSLITNALCGEKENQKRDTNIPSLIMQQTRKSSPNIAALLTNKIKNSPQLSQASSIFTVSDDLADEDLELDDWSLPPSKKLKK